MGLLRSNGRHDRVADRLLVASEELAEPVTGTLAISSNDPRQSKPEEIVAARHSRLLLATPPGSFWQTPVQT
jgi:hypothetical protein